MKKILIIVCLILLAGIVYFSYTLFFEDKIGKGALQVTSTPEAEVYLNGEKIGNTTVCKCEKGNLLNTGEYTVRIVPLKGNFEPFEEKININKSTLTAVNKEFAEGAEGTSSIVTLSSISNKNQAELSVLSFPSGAKVQLDNNPVGETPLNINDSTPSDHALSVSKEGYKEKSIAIRTVKGHKLTALISLGIIPIESSPSAETQTTRKVVILDTPTGFLRVREASTTASLEIDRITPGQTYEMLTEGDGWYQIKLDDERVGWISAQYAEKE